MPLCLCQTVHLAAGRARCVEEHIALLDAASQTLLGRAYAPGARQLTARVEALAVAEHFPTGVSGFVRVEVDSEGERFSAAGVSLYAGYAFRSLQPVAISIDCDLPQVGVMTSAGELTNSLLNALAQREGADVAVWCDRNGYCRTVDCAPLFAVRQQRVTALSGWSFAEEGLLRKALLQLGMTYDAEPLDRAALSRAEEVFYLDYRGITALSRLDGMPLMSLRAERIAAALERVASSGVRKI